MRSAPGTAARQWAGRAAGRIAHEWPLLAVAGVAAALRFVRLGHPNRQYFDEYYYANQAAQYLFQGVERPFGVHPPVGKWMIASGIELFGFTPFGSRFASAVAGTLTVAVVYLTARRLFPGRWPAAMAAALVAVDGLAFTMSRIAMLDVFLGLFIALGFLFLVIGQQADGPRWRRWRWWWLAGAAFGFGCATKWSGILALAGGVVFVLVAEGTRWWRSRTVVPWRQLLTVAGAFVLLPGLIYLVSYVPWFAHFSETRAAEEVCEDGPCQPSLGTQIAAWRREQRDIFRFHRDLRTDHRYSAPARTWPLLLEPVAMRRRTCASRIHEQAGSCEVPAGRGYIFLSVGNPVLWLLAIPSIGALAWWAVSRRDWLSASIVGFTLVQWVPWLFQERRVFLFYALPIVPFLALAVTSVSTRLVALPRLRWLPPALTVAAAALFVYLYPIMTGVEMSLDEMNRRLLLDSW